MTPPAGHRLQGYSSPRDLERFPVDDEGLGRGLFSSVVRALVRGRPAPAVFVLYEDRIDRFPMAPLSEQSPAAQRRLFASMAGQNGVQCMAVVGAFRFRGDGPLNGQLVASVFVEWPDNRWWTAWQPIGPDLALIGTEPQIRCAVEGSPRPGGVGGWFALARRHGLKLRLQRSSPPVH
jgi:hypothetical protein